MTSLSFQFIASMHIILVFWVWMGTSQETDPSNGTPSTFPTTTPTNSTESHHTHHSDGNMMTSYMASLFLAVPTILGLSAAAYLVKTNFSLKRNNEEKDDEHAVEDKIYTAMMMNSSHSLKMGMTNPMLLKASQRQQNNDKLTKKDQIHERRSDQQRLSGGQQISGSSQDLEQGVVETNKQTVQTFGAVGALLTFGSWLNTSSSSISLSSCHLPLNHTIEGEEVKMNMMEDEEGGGGGQDTKEKPRSKQVKRGWWSIFGLSRSTRARNLCYVDILRDESMSDRFLELTVATPMEESDAYLINQDALVTARKQNMGRSTSGHEDIQLNLRI